MRWPSRSMNPWLGASTFHGTAEHARAQGTRLLRLACRKSAAAATSVSVIGITSTVIISLPSGPHDVSKEHAD